MYVRILAAYYIIGGLVFLGGAVGAFKKVCLYKHWGMERDRRRVIHIGLGWLIMLLLWVVVPYLLLYLGGVF